MKNEWLERVEQAQGKVFVMTVNLKTVRSFCPFNPKATEKQIRWRSALSTGATKHHLLQNSQCFLVSENPSSRKSCWSLFKVCVHVCLSGSVDAGLMHDTRLTTLSCTGRQVQTLFITMALAEGLWSSIYSTSERSISPHSVHEGAPGTLGKAVAT